MSRLRLFLSPPLIPHLPWILLAAWVGWILFSSSDLAIDWAYDLYEALAVGKADALLAASVFHFGTYRIAEAKRYLADRGMPVRPVPEP